MLPMFRLWRLSILLAPLVALLIWGALREDVEQLEPGAWTRSLAEREADPWPRSYQDLSGRVVIPSPPQRIVSGTIFSDAVLLAICPRERIRALIRTGRDSRYSPVAEESRGFSRHVGGDPVEILAEEPDFITVSSFSRKAARDLLGKTSGAVVRFRSFESVSHIQDNIRALGWMIGLDREAEKLVQGMQSELEVIATGASQRKSWRVLLYLGGRTGGVRTTFDSLLSHVGARNAAREIGLDGSAPISPEQVIALDPDVIVLGAETGDGTAAREGFLQIPGMKSLRAVEREHLLMVPNAWLLSTSHHAARAARRIADTLDRWGGS